MIKVKLSEMLADEGLHPTPGQVAGELLRQRLHQVRDQIEHANTDRLRGELGKIAGKHRAAG